MPARDSSGRRPDRPEAGRTRRPGSSPAAGEPSPPAAGFDFGRGELTPRDEAEFRALKRLIQARARLCCDGYKERVLRRRIAVRMRANNAQSFAAYAGLLHRDPAELQRLLDTVTINVSKFFRNASAWVLIRDTVIPQLFARDESTIRIWSAGSAAGEEAYSMAILLLQHAETHGVDVERFHVLATDIDSDALARAGRAEYDAFAFTEVSDATRSRWFDGPRRDRLRDEVKRRVRFEHLDLMADPFPADQHLILCRNVLIYFEREVQQRLFTRFHEALAVGGFLQLGKVETLFGAAPGLFETISARERLFRRP